MTEGQTLKGLCKDQVVERLTGIDTNFPQDDVPEISIDFSSEQDIDNAFILAKKLERRYTIASMDDELDYFKGHFSRIDMAYVSGNVQEFKKSLQGLISRIYYM